MDTSVLARALLQQQYHKDFTHGMDPSSPPEKGGLYPGYEDYSPAGRASIDAYNKARGKNFENPHDEAVKQAYNAWNDRRNGDNVEIPTP